MYEIADTASPAPESGLAGFIDSVDEAGIRGWALDLGDRARRLSLEAYIDGVLVGRGISGIERPDVAEVLGAPARCGFQIRWDPSELAALAHIALLRDAPLLTVTLTGDAGFERTAPLPSGSVVLGWIGSSDAYSARYFARIDDIGTYRIRGFVRDRFTLDPARVEILVDDTVVTTVICDRKRNATTPSGEDLDCGFEWHVPARLRDGSTKKLAARIAGTTFELAGSGIVLQFPKAARTASPIGIFVSAGPVWITGWAVDDRDPEPLAVELHIDGKRVAQGLAGQYGADLDGNPAYCYRNVHSRFSFATPQTLLDGWEHEVKIVVPDWGANQSPDAALRWTSHDHFGEVDISSPSRLSGWVAFRNAPDTAALLAPVEVRIAGKLHAHGFLGSPRPDVVQSGIGIAAYGFEVALTGVQPGRVSAHYRGVTLRDSLAQSGPVPRIKGNLDGVARDVLTGWAVDLERPHETLELGLYVDGSLSTRFLTSHPRADVSSAIGLPVTRVGFVLPTPHALLDGASHVVEVRALSDDTVLPSRVRSVQFARSYTGLPSEDSHPVLSEFIARTTRAPVRGEGKPLVSIVILNRNGGEILDALFRSFCAVNSLARHEFIVVDHASTDASLGILARWTSGGLPLTVVPLTYNGSFSASNNLAIRDYARGEYVLLLNNDIVFVQDVLPAMIDTLAADPAVGIVGVKLLDVVEDQGSNLYPPIQHLGIRYGYFGRNGVLPYDEKLSIDSASEAFRLINPAGVTGAVMLLRRNEYLAIGGLEEEYFYGYEDVDLCLKVRVLNRQEIVCRNDLQVLHHRGYSRLSGREQAVFEKLDTNKVVLMKRWGHALNRYYRASLIRGDRVYTSERLRIAFAVTEEGPDAVAGDYFTALELARAIAKLGFAEPVFLSERVDWYDLERINVLIVMRHDYDLRSIRNARRDLVKVAWIRNHFEGWLAQRWFGQFDQYLSASSRFVDELATRGYRGEWFPIATNPAAMSAGTPGADLAADVGFNDPTGQWTAR